MPDTCGNWYSNHDSENTRYVWYSTKGDFRPTSPLTITQLSATDCWGITITLPNAWLGYDYAKIHIQPASVEEAKEEAWKRFAQALRKLHEKAQEVLQYAQCYLEPDNAPEALKTKTAWDHILSGSEDLDKG